MQESQVIRQSAPVAGAHPPGRVVEDTVDKDDDELSDEEIG